MQFKQLNSQLNREVIEFERAAAEGTHHLGSFGDAYQPASSLEAEAQTYVLGGGGVNVLGSTSLRDESVEERRKRMLEATVNRLKKEEEELEQSCGTASGPSAHNS